MLLHILDWLLWCIMAASVCYVLIFTLASLLPRRKGKNASVSKVAYKFLVLFPAYQEDAVIIPSVDNFLHQTYPREKYRIVVISDHMQPSTNKCLASKPITLLEPSFEKSSKAKAMQYAIDNVTEEYDFIVILDADNIVEPTFLERLNQESNKGHQAIQCHRTAKNANNDIAVLDGLSEEINNTIFRKGHNLIGLSSALIGSGMCFDYQWFRENVFKLDSAVEDRELEALLLKQGIYIHYAEDIYVQDEKVSDSNNFQRQRLRWMTGQVQAFLNMLPYLPKAIVSGNINYVDKTIQQALIPRSILLMLVAFFAVITILVVPCQSIKWWCLLLVLCTSLFFAIPIQLRKRAILSKALSLPKLVWKMMTNILKIDHKNTDFIHTTHDK